MPIGSQVIYNAGDLILSTVSSSGNTFVETKIAAATSSVILFNNSANLTSASLSSLTVGNAVSSSYALTASFALNAGGGSGTVSGSTNYIAKFISSTSVGTSSIYESGSNVGIGTTDPQYKLDVRPAGANARIGIAELGAWPAASTFAYFQHSLLNNLDGGNYALVQSSAGETFLNAAQGQVLHFRINNGEVGQFNSSGYLGIGHNNNPITAKLEVSGSPGEYLFNVKSTSTPYTLFASGSGRVGIGTNVLPNKLTIDGNVTASSYTSSIVNAVGFLGTASYALTASAVSIVPANVFVQGGNSFGTTATLGTNDASALIFETNGTGRVTIDTNGYVGIAQPTPTAYLHVGQNTASDTNNYGIRIDKNGTLGSPGSYQNSAIYLSDLAGDGPSTVDITGQISFNFPRLQASDISASKVSHLIIAHDSALGPMRVDGKGNLWVGYDRNTANTSSNSFSTLIYGGLTVGSGYQTTTVSDGTAIFSGNVGIGTYNPQFLLDVSGSSRHGVISTNVHQFTGSVNINGSLFSNANITASNISASRTGSFSIVGIGTTSPAARLAVGSNPTYAAGVTLIVGTPGNPSTSGTSQPYANLRLGTNTGNSQVLDFGIYDASPYGSWIQAAGGGNLAFPSPLVLNPTGGSLGIGTSNPVATLDIENAVANIPVLNLGGGIGGENVSDLYVLNSYNANTGVGYSAKVIGINISGSLTAQNIPVQRTVWSGVTSATAIVLGADGPRQGTQDNAFQIWTTSEGTSGSLLTQKFSLTSTGDVGIGTTSPGSKLTVSGSIESLTDNGGEGGQLILRGNTYRYNIDNFNGQALRFFREDDITTANGQVLMYLSSSGNVGIGNTDPSFLIDVSGNSRHGAISTNAHQFTGSVSLSDGLSLTNLTASNISASGYIIASRITSSNVLINGNLTVTGSIFASLFSASYIYITSSQLVVTDNIITLNALSPYQRYAGMEMYDSGSGNLSSFLWDGQGDYFFVTGSGVNSKIIVGPDQQTNLTSGKLTKATGTNIIGDSIVTDNGSGIIVSGYISGSSVITGNITASNISASGTGTFNNVGIGTSTLRNQLTVIGPAQNTSAISDSGNTGGTIFIGSSLNNVNQGGTLLFSTINDLGTYLPQWGIKTLFTNGTGNGVSDLAFSTRTTGSATSLTEQVRFTSNGRVGIGTNSPATTLNVSGSTRISAGELQIEGDNATIRLYRTTGINYFDWASGQNFYLGTVTSLGGAGRSNKMVILDSGNVGIGTTVPGSKLQINDSTPTLTLRADDGGVSRKAYIDFYTTFYNYPSDVGARRTSTISTGFADGTYGTWGTEFMAFHVGSGSANDSALLPIERMRIDGSGNIGIGTSTIIGKLQINSTSAPYYGPATSSTNANGIFILGNTTADVVNTFGVDASGTAYAWIQPRKVASATYYALSLNPNGGNVGIGTSSPSFLLDVSGSSRHGFTSTNVHQFTGSVNISGSVNLAGSFVYDNAVLLDFGRTTTPAISTNYVVLQNITGSYNSAFFDYFASSASNFRAGTVIAGWSGSSINYTEYSTTDIGNTNQLTMSVDLSSSFVRLLTTVSTTTNWNIKSSGRYL